MSADLREVPGLHLLPPLLLTPEDVARRFGVSSATVRRWCAAGRLRHFRHGRVLRIYGDAVADALRTGRLPGASA